MNEDPFDLTRWAEPPPLPQEPDTDAWFWLLFWIACCAIALGLVSGCSDGSSRMWLIREEVYYPWKHCVYQDIVSEYIITIKASQACPQLM